VLSWLNSCTVDTLKGAENVGDTLGGLDPVLRCSGWDMGS